MKKPSESLLPLPERRTAEARGEATVGQLGLWDTVSIIVGIVIGVGIYETPPLVFRMAGSPTLALAVWAIGGLLVLAGALCYAELASTYPRTGGDYVYLTRAFGPFVGFLFGWAQLAVVITGSIGMMAYVVADYADTLWSLGPSSKLLYATLSILMLTLLNLAGVVVGKGTQNVLSVLKLAGLAFIIVVGLFVTPELPAAAVAEASGGPSWESFAAAMVFVLLTYGGWNDAAFVTAEMRDRRRNIPRALLLGVTIIAGVYLLLNAAFLRTLGFEGVRTSSAVAVDMLQATVGDFGGRAIAVLVIVSALSSMSALIFAGSRVYATLGEDHTAFALLGRWNTLRGAPIWSLLAQSLITLAMVLAVGSEAGQSALDGLLRLLGLAPVEWSGRGGFGLLLQCTAPIFWMFFLLTSLSLFVLRWKDQDRPRAFAVPWYPVTPLLFTATCLYMLDSGVRYAGSLGLVGAAALLAGAPLYLLSRRRKAPGHGTA